MILLDNIVGLTKRVLIAASLAKLNLINWYDDAIEILKSFVGLEIALGIGKTMKTTRDWQFN